MRYFLIICLLAILSNTIAAQCNNACSALNENPCLFGEPHFYMLLPELYPHKIQRVPPGYASRQIFDDQPTGEPANVWRTPNGGYRMVINGITGEWGFSTEFVGSGCLALTVDGDFYVELEEGYLPGSDEFTLGAHLWGDGQDIDLGKRSILEAGGSDGERWIFFVGGDARTLTVYVYFSAQSPNTGVQSVIEWTRIAVNPVAKWLCFRPVPGLDAPDQGPLSSPCWA